MAPSQYGATAYVLLTVISVITLKELNTEVQKPYMDEPFHVPQVQAYCRGEWTYWDPKITTPPGLYGLTIIMKNIFLFKCNLPTLRLTPLVTLLVLPFALTRLLCFHQRVRTPSSSFVPTLDAVVLSAFPIVWFFGFLYYTEVPSLLFVVSTIVASSQNKHKLAALLGLISCTFRQTNIIWVLYAYASSQLMYLKYRRVGNDGKPPAKLHDPPALDAGPRDLIRTVLSLPGVLLDILPAFIPYAIVCAIFAGFVIWNGGIVLGDKSNHVPAFHIPQLYYFVAFSTMLGWPVLISTHGGPRLLMRKVYNKMFKTPSRIAITLVLSLIMGVTVHKFTIHHPFLLSDNRHYTFYVWKRLFLPHPIVPYLYIPGYIACAWMWFLTIGRDKSQLQALLLPICTLPILLPTPLLEPRYFLIPYILMRAQVVDVPVWGLLLEGAWYAAVNAVTMWVFLYKERVGVGRFMW
ncbi:glucosyltransferase [Stereum hirsutum FP-91666 SS1]|uniref:glucosyltransferase n=1 Tax=Stereum hirsutum (strain FP-91666) TaxID=721885 RepID=UPI000440A84A|nr:glucosyltransferase [Stereum hirsutum FP-91666 SS1]EIM92928.1 glucosyltransferase [Stereum hirsutum FP-91666 SS1]